MKQDIFNLIILDESGSMGHITNQTISGCNETINTIKAAQKDFADTQRQYVSIFAFQSGGAPSRYLCKNIPAVDARHITSDDYRPCGCTPLYDAIGSTLVDLKATVKDHELAIGSVTIITDGMENSSTHYTLPQVAKMIEALKEMGWNFNFIGANIDVKATAASLNIDNHLEFKQDDAGTREMFARERQSRMAYMKRANDVMVSYNGDIAPACIDEETKQKERLSLIEKMKQAGKNFFNS